ncbi:hypothetical protein RHS01_05316 [Rhizoctonia solani]|uniref:Uncharacterized protein n=1 Tax=Rhizoctonia solani TaxID=456999 RepID=A0A8H7M4Z6_9AGAM|nr:hypothetical protein RHS01_05316 [Rhizoctonia solani]
MGCIPSKPPPEPSAPTSKSAPKPNEASGASNIQHIPEVTVHEATPTHSRKSTEPPKLEDKRAKDTGIANADGSASGGTGGTAAGAVATGAAGGDAGGSGGGGGEMVGENRMASSGYPTRMNYAKLGALYKYSCCL